MEELKYNTWVMPRRYGKDYTGDWEIRLVTESGKILKRIKYKDYEEAKEKYQELVNKEYEENN